MRVLMFAIRYDTTDWATGFIPVWARRLAYRVDALDVVALSVGNKGEVPSNMRVYSMGKGFSGNKAWLLFNFYRHALRLVPRADAVFVHMIPRYALLALPVTKLWRKPLSLWYTHREPSPDLQRALPFVNQVLTAVDSSFPLETCPGDGCRATGDRLCWRRGARLCDTGVNWRTVPHAIRR